MSLSADIPQFIGNDSKFNTAGLGIGFHAQSISRDCKPLNLRSAHSLGTQITLRNSKSAVNKDAAVGEAFLRIGSNAFFKEYAEIHAISMCGNGEQESNENNNKAHGGYNTLVPGEPQ